MWEDLCERFNWNNSAVCSLSTCNCMFKINSKNVLLDIVFECREENIFKNYLARCLHYNTLNWWKWVAEQSGYYDPSLAGEKKKEKERKKHYLWVMVCEWKKKDIKNIWISGREPIKLLKKLLPGIYKGSRKFSLFFLWPFVLFALVMINIITFVI